MSGYEMKFSDFTGEKERWPVFHLILIFNIYFYTRNAFLALAFAAINEIFENTLTATSNEFGGKNTADPPLSDYYMAILGIILAKVFVELFKFPQFFTLNWHDARVKFKYAVQLFVLAILSWVNSLTTKGKHPAAPLRGTQLVNADNNPKDSSNSPVGYYGTVFLTIAALFVFVFMNRKDRMFHVSCYYQDEGTWISPGEVLDELDGRVVSSNNKSGQPIKLEPANYLVATYEVNCPGLAVKTFLMFTLFVSVWMISFVVGYTSAFWMCVIHFSLMLAFLGVLWMAHDRLRRWLYTPISS